MWTRFGLCGFRSPRCGTSSSTSPARSRCWRPCGAVLEPGGVLLLSVPNGPHALWKAKLRRYVRGTGADVLGIGEHVVHYSAATLSMVLTRAGYERIDVRGGPVGVFDGSFRLLKRAGMEALTAAGDLVGTPLGATLLAVARRPDGPDRPRGAVRT